ncbi:MAG: metal ABC transporter permease [Armatimonadota bacterium]
MDPTSVLVIVLPAFCLCIVLVGLLSYLGLHVIKREIIFVDLALAQIAALGTLIGFVFGIPLHTTASYWFSVALTAMAAVVFTLCRFRESRVPQEAVIGLTYAIAAAVAILLIDKAPHGAEHVKEILTGSILWVKWRTIGVTALAYAGVGAFHYAFRDKFLLISESPEKAEAVGVNLHLWDFLFYLSFGVVITLSVSVAGVLLVFVFLVAPAVMALAITDRLFYQVLLGWGLGLFATGAGLFGSYVLNLPAGPGVVAAYAVALLVVAVVVFNARAENRAAAVRTTAVTAAFFVVALGLLFAAGHVLGGRSAGESHHGTAAHEEHEPLPPEPGMAGEPSEETLTETLSATESIEEVEQLFMELVTPEARADIVCRAMELDADVGASLAAEFLETEPPLFFRQRVLDALSAAAGTE